MSESAPDQTTRLEHIDQNIESILEIQKREWDQRSPSQRRVEAVNAVIGRPMYLVGLLLTTAAWVTVNLLATRLGIVAFDPPPFALLDGVLTFAALVSTTVVLIAQNRQTRLEQRHAHVALQLSLATEQKVTTIINLLEELRGDLPMVRDRVNPDIEAQRQKTDAVEVHAAIQKKGLSEEPKPG